MNILGISAGFHDAAISVINRQGDILFAGHSERYSKLKNEVLELKDNNTKFTEDNKLLIKKGRYLTNKISRI